MDKERIARYSRVKPYALEIQDIPESEHVRLEVESCDGADLVVCGIYRKTWAVSVPRVSMSESWSCAALDERVCSAKIPAYVFDDINVEYADEPENSNIIEAL